MVLDLVCDQKKFISSYSGWNTIRKTILRISLEYIKNKFKDIEKLEEQLDYGIYIGEYSNYDYFKQIVLNIIVNMDKDYSKDLGIDRTIDLFISLINKKVNTDALIYFKMGGLVALCNKSDCEGYYTPGNSLDICNLLDLIKPVFSVKNDSDYKNIYNLNLVNQNLFLGAKMKILY
jgi:hypothetical protein